MAVPLHGMTLHAAAQELPDLPRDAPQAARVLRVLQAASPARLPNSRNPVAGSGTGAGLLLATAVKTEYWSYQYAV